ncbi:hypothetical protein CHARACLAT_002632 [Characodon lateralis]|uniref:Uncharacterized protein n=1 Tax=Characodon lateralis TaxID=208331 RepID=A0ABU7EZM9_9TELE|nr:hypothetical protein [Characodon lateralis]
MYKLTPECWLQSHGLQTCVSRHPGRLELASGVLNHQVDDEEEDKEVFPAVCHPIMGHNAVTHEADDAQWFPFGAPVHSQAPTTLGLPGSDHFSQHQITGADHVEMLQECVGCRCGEGQVIETNQCLGVYGQRVQEGLNPCWSGSPFNHYVVRQNMVVEVEVVEEVAVEDTVELMAEDLYADGLLIQSEQVFSP